MQSGYESGKCTFYIWEGVCFYLITEAVDDVLKFVTQHSSSGSSIIFDYVLESFVKGEYKDERARKGAECHANLGEPYIFGIEAHRIEPFLNERGFSVVSDLGPQELDQTYLMGSDRTLHGHVFDFIRIVHARITGLS